MPPTTPTTPDRAKQFAAKMLGFYTGAALVPMIHVGYETGLFEAAAQGPCTCGELARRAGLQERYVREWLGAMTSAGIFEYEAAPAQYRIPEEHARALTGNGLSNLAPMSKVLHAVSRPLPQLIDCFRQGSGVPSAAFRPAFTESMDAAWRRIYDSTLVDGFLKTVPGLDERLRGGINVLELGCGTGHAANLMGRTYPRSRIVGVDVAKDAIEQARAEAAEMNLSNVEFRLEDITTRAQASEYDLATAFDTIHDLADPATMLLRVRESLNPGGLFLMVEFKFSSQLENNASNPFAALYYSISTMYCMTVSLAAGGHGLGACWGEETARRLLADAGFTDVTVLDCPRPQNSLFVCRV
jgi:2-polyprenyl-3-methyl-5-hydroxy-6-metoxy-1,4-benzoquinol methylase